MCQEARRINPGLYIVIYEQLMANHYCPRESVVRVSEAHYPGRRGQGESVNGWMSRCVYGLQRHPERRPIATRLHRERGALEFEISDIFTRGADAFLWNSAHHFVSTT